MSDGYWDIIDAQLKDLRTARSSDDVMAILSPEGTTANTGFFGGGGGDGSVMESLFAAGWKLTWYEADYHWCMWAPGGSVITYVEGDVYRGNRKPLPRNNTEES